MLTLKNFDRVLVSYLYAPDQLIAKVSYKRLNGPEAVLETVRGKRKGVVVALGAGILGWSLCNPKGGYSSKKGYYAGDVFDKAKGLDLALKRADIASGLNPVDREAFYDKVPFSVLELFEEMEVRAALYFARDADVNENDDLPF